MQCIAFDSHKHYTWALVETEKGKLVRERRIDHARGALRGFLEEFEPGSLVATGSCPDSRCGHPHRGW